MYTTSNSDCRWAVTRSLDFQVTKSLLCTQPGVVGEEVPYPRCSNPRATDLDYILTPNAIDHSWAYQREPLFCGHAVSQMWFCMLLKAGLRVRLRSWHILLSTYCGSLWWQTGLDGIL